MIPVHGQKIHLTSMKIVEADNFTSTGKTPAHLWNLDPTA
jgi:hypothetical protein